jgi:hypothetical protein
MFSVENFYWILYQHLLKPVGLDCWYYYPFGTQDHFSNTDEFQRYFYRLSHANHVLFHFDQEPLWSDTLGSKYETMGQTWSYKIIKILANSEHSQIKKKILKDRRMQDWYFFYHGFAALDWFRDTRYIHNEHAIENAFLCLNHIVQSRRIYRLDLVSRLVAQGIHDRGTISLHATADTVRSALDSAGHCLTDDSLYRISQLLKIQNLPWTIDNAIPTGAFSADCGHQQYELWQRSLFHVVTETVFYDPKLHLTEKIFKPIVSKRPFILVGAPGNLAYLRSYGFRTFDRWIDESYDSEQDPDARLDLIMTQIEKISALSQTQLRDLHRDMQPVLNHNKQHFFTQFRKIITDELIENFDTCVRVWNHGRVDGREIPVHLDLDSVRHVLLQ